MLAALLFSKLCLDWCIGLKIKQSLDLALGHKTKFTIQQKRICQPLHLDGMPLKDWQKAAKIGESSKKKLYPLLSFAVVYRY